MNSTNPNINDLPYAENRLEVLAILYKNTELEFVGSEVRRDSVYLLFKPFAKAEEIVNNFYTRTLPPVQPAEYWSNYRELRNKVFRIKEQWQYQNEQPNRQNYNSIGEQYDDTYHR